jgi:Fe-S cluster biogenesis protein NfuA
VVAEAEAVTAGAADTATNNKELLDRIEAVLDEHVRPGLRADGGGVVVVGLDADNILQVRLTGACQGCSSSIMTMTMSVEATLKARVSEIRFVEAVP